MGALRRGDGFGRFPVFFNIRYIIGASVTTARYNRKHITTKFTKSTKEKEKDNTILETGADQNSS